MKTFLKIVTLAIICFFTACTSNVTAKKNTSKIILNQKYIEEINESNNYIDIKNHLAIFENVFNLLPNEVTIYPSENYYYFEFINDGISYQGNIGLFKDELKNNSINFGYYTKSGHIFDDMSDIFEYYSLGEKDGLIVKQIDSYTNSIQYKNKTVFFKSFQFDLEKNKQLKLTENEILIAPTFDESGTAFYLIYNEKMNLFYWILNEHTKFQEKLNTYNEDLYYSKRTDFVYYNDKEYDRKILVGVNYYNIRKNNWFDGPFDQMPDNIIENGNAKVLPYLQKVFPEEASNFDKYGNFLNDESSRIALSNYQTYINISNIVKKINQLKLDTKNRYEFIYNLTHS